jgi:hypothetical protein
MSKRSKKSNIKKKAEALYDKYLDKIQRKIGDSTTYSDQLEKLGSHMFRTKFKGVFSSDKIPKHIKSNDMLIVNLDSSEMNGSHWIAIVKHKKKMLVYDSFARKTYKILPELYETTSEKNIFQTEDDVEQGIKESNCGQRFLAFLEVFHKHGYKYAEYI